ncbi:MAG: hypothetical protein SNF68_07200 [Rikenellaceae bacterium]
MRPTKLFLLFLLCAALSQAHSAPIVSIETPYTISRVTTAIIDKQEYIVASSYEGRLLCLDFRGNILWENKLSGSYNLDIYCCDLDGDGSYETLAANSDGSLYCIGEDGKNLWQFRPTEAPMNAATMIHHDGSTYVACGGYDTNLYYLDHKGKLISQVAASTYSKEKGWGSDAPQSSSHIANFLRTIKRTDGSEVLVMQGVINSMSAKGGVYLFEPLATKPYRYIPCAASTVVGDLSINDLSSTSDKLLLGSSKDTRGGYITELDIESGKSTIFDLSKIAKSESNKFGYRVAQCEAMKIGKRSQRVIVFGSCIILPTDANSAETTEVLTSKYAYNDIAKDSTSSKLLLASEQGGGNCIHILDLNDKGWRKSYKNLVPSGNVASILAGSKSIKEAINNFTLPEWESLDSRPTVCFMSESPNKDPETSFYADKIHARYPSPIFLNSIYSRGSQDPDTWSRDTMSNDFYRDRRDQRQKYTLTQEEVLNMVNPAFEGDSKGMSMWGGHGNDPFYYSPDTQHKIMSLTGDKQQTVLIFPEMEARGADASWLMANYIYPMADHARQHNSKLFIRSKHLFWLGNVYEPHWSKLISGDYADVFIPSMEETSDKSMELSLMGRLGVWMSGAVDSWGSRCARDNPSYNRLRQHSHQNLPNGFLRNMIYHISLGAQYIDNFKVDQEYMSMLWEMIAKGLLYVPKREEIVSFNPVRLSIVEPDQEWLDEGNNVKWTIFFDQQSEDANPWVMGRLNGSWPAAPTTEWDFSRYAAGATERRLNFISSFNNGHVLLTPPTDSNATRGNIEEYMHPLYKGETKEFFTDGRYYYPDAERTQKYSPKEYYCEIERAIEEGAKLLPLTVKGEVGWVAAQSAPTHLRVTIIDGGYINPSVKEAVIVIGTAKVKRITNLMTDEVLDIKDGECHIKIPCGGFAPLDVELNEAL